VGDSVAPFTHTYSSLDYIPLLPHIVRHYLSLSTFFPILSDSVYRLCPFHAPIPPPVWHDTYSLLPYVVLSWNYSVLYRPYCCYSFHSSSLVFFFNNNIIFVTHFKTVLIPASLGPIHRSTLVNSFLFFLNFFSYNICALFRYILNVNNYDIIKNNFRFKVKTANKRKTLCNYYLYRQVPVLLLEHFLEMYNSL